MNKPTFDFNFSLWQFIFMKLSTKMIFFASTPIRVTAIYEQVLN